MMIFTPQKSRRLDLSPESSRFLDMSPSLDMPPMLSNPGLVMMGAMLSSNTFGDFLNSQPIGPTEAFFPLTTDAILGFDSDDSGEDQDAGEDDLQIDDFITFHQESSDEEEEEEDPAWSTDVASTPIRPTTSASAASAASDASMADVHPLLRHFDNNSGAVGAFRRNQIDQQLILSDKATQDSLAFSGPYYHGTLRGIKSGSMDTVTTPITPVRRQKRNSTASISGFPDLNSSPLSQVSQKRKASAGLGNMMHKKQRSISEVEALHI
jgi:hypothetical protein